MVVSYGEAPPRWRQGRGRESKAGACAKHVVVIARLAADLVSRGSVKRPCWAAAVVEALCATTFGGRTQRTHSARDGARRAVLSYLARLAAQRVRGIISRSTDRTLAAAFALLVRAHNALVAGALASVGLDGSAAAFGLLRAARWRIVAHVGLRALTGTSKVGEDRVRARQAWARNRCALGAEIANGAGCRRHRCLCATHKARWAKPCTRRARLFASKRSIATKQADPAGKGVVQIVRPEWQRVHSLTEQAWVLPPGAWLCAVANDRGYPVARGRG
jgi:hypothetical protein